MPKRFKHAADLTLVSLVNPQIDDGSIGLRADHAQLRGRAAKLVEHNSTLQLDDLLGTQPSMHDRAVRFLDAESRMHQRVGEVPIVGQEQQTRRIIVEASNRHDARRFRRQEIEDRAPPLRIAQRRHDARRFVQCEIHAPRVDADPFPIHFDDIVIHDACA